MQMTKAGATKPVPDELVDFMAARGWKPAATPTPETPKELDDDLVDEHTEDDDVDHEDDVNQHTTTSTTDPAEEQS